MQTAESAKSTSSLISNIENQSIESIFSKAVRHHGYGELSKAEALYQSILVKEPNHIATMKKYGVLSYQFGDYLLAEQMFEEAYSMVSFDEQLSVNLVMCKMKLDKLGEALPVIEAILKHNPDSAAANSLRLQINEPNAEAIE